MDTQHRARASRFAPQEPIWRVVATAAFGLTAATMTMAAAPAAMTSSERAQYLLQHQADPSAWTPRYLTKPPLADQQAAERLQAMQAQGLTPSGPGKTIPYWSTTIHSPLDGITYNVSMVGKSPFVAPQKNTMVKYVPIVVRLHFPGGFVFDPTKNGNCDSMPVATRFFNSPLFKTHAYTSNGVNVTPSGNIQLISAFQRANFWNAVQGTAYGVTLVPSQKTQIVVDYTAHVTGDQVVSVTSQCVTGGTNPFGLIDINEYDALVQSLAATYSKPNEIPLVLTYNVVEFIGNPSNCCVIGYHSAVQSATATQVYSVGAYVDPGVFSGLSDIGAWSHEIAELVDDPFVQSVSGIPGNFNNDRTPAWGHIGQVSACQNNLEDGDPLTGTQFALSGSGGFTYHYQDLAFHDWFYRTPSTSTGGSGSFQGLLPGGVQAALCH